MSKKFIQVKDFLGKLERIAVVAGISFVLFMQPIEDYANDLSQSCLTTSTISSEYPIISSDGKIDLMPISNANEGMIEIAFDTFTQSNNDGKKLRSVCDFMSKGFNGVVAEKFSVDGDPESGFLSMACKLHNDVVISIVKNLDTMDDSFVAFNIFHGRKLIVSDIMDVVNLSKYIKNVQSRLG